VQQVAQEAVPQQFSPARAFLSSWNFAVNQRFAAKAPIWLIRGEESQVAFSAPLTSKVP
jgi:hypothetical protein